MKIGESKLLSIVIPVYNAENYLDMCLQSVYNQTYQNWECILVDDESKDRSSDICKGWQKKDSRFKYYRKKNGGVADARNFGIDYSEGEYIAFVDNDDLLHPTMYERLIENLEKSNCDVSCCGYVQDYRSYKDVIFDIMNHLKANEVKILDNREDIYYSIVKGKGIEGLIWNKVYKKRDVNNIRFNSNVSLVDDAEFSIRFFKNVDKVCYTDSVYYHWMQHRDNQTTTGSYLKYENAAYAYETMVNDVQIIIEDNKTIDILKSHSLIWHINALEKGIKEKALDRDRKLYYKRIVKKYTKYSCYYNKNVQIKAWLIDNVLPGYTVYIYCKKLMEKFNDRRIIRKDKRV